MQMFYYNLLKIMVPVVLSMVVIARMVEGVGKSQVIVMWSMMLM